MGGSRLAWAIAAVVLVGAIGGGAALLYANRGGVTAEAAPAQGPLARYAKGPLARLEAPAEPKAAPDYLFQTRDGQPARFADFQGKVVVVNLWAMWCAPCRTEMPTLARLAQAYQGKDVVVLPINVDVGEDAAADARSFIDVHEPLPLYRDPKFRLPFELPGKGKMPQTVLIDRRGQVRAAFAGEADWASPEARALVDALLAEPA
jgi:thiol-disulfide isomerase/thioredoxin